MRVEIQSKLVVGFGELIPMKSGYGTSEERDISKVTKDNDKPDSKQNGTLWWTQDNWPSLKKSLEILKNPIVDGVCNEGDLELGIDSVTKMTVFNCLKFIVSKKITYNNALPMKH